MVAITLLQSLTLILTSKESWKNQLKSYNFLLNVYILLCILGKMGNKRLPVCLNTLTHKSILLGFTLPLNLVEFCSCGFVPTIMELCCIWNGNYSADFVSLFDYASVKPCKNNCNWQGQAVQIPSMIKKRRGFESKRNFENNNKRKESWTCFFFF